MIGTTVMKELNTGYLRSDKSSQSIAEHKDVAVSLISSTIRACKMLLNWQRTTAEVYSEPFQTSKMEFFVKIVNGSKPLTIFVKYSILDVWKGSECASAKDICNKKQLKMQSPEGAL